MKTFKLLLLVLLLIATTKVNLAQTDLYDLYTIQKIEIYFSQSNWDYQLDTAKLGAGGYIIADWVKINNTQFNAVGVKYKGNSSYDSTYHKNPFHIELDHVTPQSYQGIKDIKLANCYADPSMIREVLSYYILGHYMIAPRANYAQVYINDDYIGLYANTESIGKSYCSQNFNISGTTFISCSPYVTPGPGSKSNLKYIPGADSSAYFNFYEVKSDFGWNDLVSLCDIVTNDPSEIENAMNIDRLLWMLAFNMVLVNLDSYTGVFAQNYYLYKDATSRFNTIVWDLNMSLGGFPFIGSSNTSMGGLTIEQMNQLSPTVHASDPYWPLINIVMNNPIFRKKYFAHMRTIANEMFTNDHYIEVAQSLQALIDTAVQSDQNKFFTYEQFQNGLITDYPVLNYQVPGISNLMSARMNYLQTHQEFSASAPLIISVLPDIENPVYNSQITIRADVLNANYVVLGYRLSSTANFTMLSMYDDGLHNDGMAGDNVYGAGFTLSSSFAQYYLVATNDAAASFSPERAEYEFYSIEATLETPAPGEVVINEFIAKNNSGFISEYGEYADWIELYNNTNEPMSLFGLYLSDKADNLKKFAFPQDIIIGAQDFLVIIADEMPGTEQYLHCNFKLSADGEVIILSNGAGEIIDNISFGAQTADVSMGRCPNGTGDFEYFSQPTMGEPNCSVGTRFSIDPTFAIKVFPNPATNRFNISVAHPELLYSIRLFNSQGKLIMALEPEKAITTESLAPGLYLLRYIFRTGEILTTKVTVL